ncbi:uncharacterized protein LOC117890243 [Drosophila subobscura]|uniref:uncharacterized protein LOC117890243 n=1 Tax=Drosophila subobscura TaxID=7241 RepID=UPI00155A87A4|nr:uncharacterized protein LOC117890243 [Drosophila subobscura]
MTSIVGAPPAGVAAAVSPWETIEWPPEIEQHIYKDWGSYYSRRRRENFAMHYFNKALDLDPKDHMTMYKRCQSKRKAAQTQGALLDSRAAASMARTTSGEKAFINLEICDALYELNQFENSMAETQNNIRQFTGNKTKSFENRLVVVEEVIQDCTGEALTAFFSKHQRTVQVVNELFKASEIVDKRPLWKVLREQGKCDVLSIPEVEEQLLSPLEIARRKRAFNIFHQTYLNESWVDVVFMKSLLNNPALLLSQCKESNYFLNKISVKQYEIVRKFMKMLQSRSPLYYENFIKYRNKQLSDRYRESYLYHVQYQTYRTMNAALKRVRVLRKERRVKTLTKYVEEVMGDYVVKKTHRVMCWKFEFLNEMYNTLGLALAEQLKPPKRFSVIGNSAILQLLHLPTDKVMEFVSFVFGDRSTHAEPDLYDPATTRAKRLQARLEHRMIFAKYSIEKCYLFHQISQCHMDQGHHSECAFAARRGVKESANCNSNLWKFLNVVQIVKANAVVHKLEQTKDALDDALPIAKALKSRDLVSFVELCMVCNQEESATKKATVVLSRRASKASNRSMASSKELSEGSD